MEMCVTLFWTSCSQVFSRVVRDSLGWSDERVLASVFSVQLILSL